MRWPISSNSTRGYGSSGSHRVDSIHPTWLIFSFPMVFFILLPLWALFTRADPTQFWATLADPTVSQAVQLTLFTSLTSTLVSIIFGLPLSFLLVHGSPRYRKLLDTLTDLPTVLPPSVAGIGLLLAFGRRGLLGPSLDAFGISIPFTSAAVVLAQTFVSAPYFIKAASLGLGSIDPELRNAAALDGANRLQTLKYVDLPIAWKALAGGAVMTWTRAIGEFGATILFAGNFPGRTQTMPLAIYVGFEGNMKIAISLSIVLVLLAFGILLITRHLLYHQYGASLGEVNV